MHWRARPTPSARPRSPPRSCPRDRRGGFALFPARPVTASIDGHIPPVTSLGTHKWYPVKIKTSRLKHRRTLSSMTLSARDFQSRHPLAGRACPSQYPQTRRNQMDGGCRCLGELRYWRPSYRISPSVTHSLLRANKSTLVNTGVSRMYSETNDIRDYIRVLELCYLTCEGPERAHVE